MINMIPQGWSLSSPSSRDQRLCVQNPLGDRGDQAETGPHSRYQAEKILSAQRGVLLRRFRCTSANIRIIGAAKGIIIATIISVHNEESRDQRRDIPCHRVRSGHFLRAATDAV